MLDHFGTKEKVDKILLRTRAIFISHMHGDHILGIPKFLQERDLLLKDLAPELRTSLLIATPRHLIKWLDDLRIRNLNHPECV